MAPQVGLMFTAAIPSLSNTRGYRLALTIVHNVAAPLAVAFMLIMETVQLAYGELAFEHFFDNNGLPWWSGPLSNLQRHRVVVVIYAWLSISVFFGVQVYYGIGD